METKFIYYYFTRNIVPEREKQELTINRVTNTYID